MTTAAISGQPVDRDGPVFREPWEASAFAMAVKLSEAGHFTWVEWAEHLSEEMRHVEADHHHDDDEDHDHNQDGTRYYHYWFSALEKLLAEKNILSADVVAERHRYLKDNPVPHDHVAKREPVCIA